MNHLLIISGSISAYKSYDLVRSLVKKDHNVRVILSKGATKFVKEEPFVYLGCQEIYSPTDDFNLEKKSSGPVLHVDLAKWADRISVIPASANFLAKVANGFADDLGTSVILATDSSKKITFYPAMNSNMWSNKITQSNIDKIKNVENYLVFPPSEGLLACGDVGPGKLPSIEEISETISYYNKVTSKKSYLITTGATIAPLDPVRYLTNASSGKTGFFLARELLRRGHKVKVISGKFATPMLEYLNSFEGYELERVVTTEQMSKSVAQSLESFDCYISSAAIGDLEFPVSDSKIKKNMVNDSLSVVKSKDILSEVIRTNKGKMKIVGFAAETEMTDETLKEKWNQKPCDLLVGTKVNSGLTNNNTSGFMNDSADYNILKAGKELYKGSLTKKELANLIASHLDI